MTDLLVTGFFAVAFAYVIGIAIIYFGIIEPHNPNPSRKRKGR